MVSLNKIVSHLDAYLRVAEITDWASALNGLQLQNSGAVRKLGAAVDVGPRTIEKAVAAKVDLLVVHHGLFWNGLRPFTAGYFAKLKLALDHDLAIYSAHLPLDIHPVVGNNALLCAALGFKRSEPFFAEKNQLIGRRVPISILRDDLVARLEKAVGGRVLVCPGGPVRTSMVGVVTGAAGAEIKRAAAEGVDTFITGEGPHWSFTVAEELGVNVLYGGHYATETFGVKALAKDLGRRFKLPWTFIDHPTGL